MLKIIEENEYFVVVSKKTNLNFHQQSSDDHQDGLFVEVSRLLGQRIYSLHRLDKVTSGLIMFAKSQTVARQIGELFSSRSVHKYYLAIAGNSPKKKQGLVKGDMLKSRRGSWKLMPTHHHPAITQFFSYSLMPGLRCYLLKPRTGKTHQLRVAMKSLGVPILGDKLYAGNVSDRVYLHAYFMSFKYQNKEYHFKDIPEEGTLFKTEEFKNCLKKFVNPEALDWPVI